MEMTAAGYEKRRKKENKCGRCKDFNIIDLYAFIFLQKSCLFFKNCIYII
jgi:hypothetical protein